MRIIGLVMEYVEESIGLGSVGALDVLKTARVMFRVSFDSFLQEGSMDEELLRYLAGFSDFSASANLKDSENSGKNARSSLQLLQNARHLQYAFADGELQDFVEHVDIPAVKFTSYDGQQFYFSSSRAVQELKSMDRTLLDFYDYIFVARTSESGYSVGLQQFA